MSESKYCKHCQAEHPLTKEFWYRLEGSPRCKATKLLKDNKYRAEHAEEKKVYLKKWREANPERHKAGNRKWREENAEKHKDNARKYYHANRDLRKVQMKTYRELNREQVNQTRREAHQKFPERRLAQNLRVRLVMALKRGTKAGSAIKDLGCSIQELKTYLEAKFQPGMTWENYGSDWHLDHIRPLANYDLTDRQVLLQLVHYTNLQPLWAAENIRKSNKE